MADTHLKYKEIILGLISFGNSPADIGKVIGISGRTVEAYIIELRKKYKARNITHLIAIAFREKIIK